MHKTCLNDLRFCFRWWRVEKGSDDMSYISAHINLFLDIMIAGIILCCTLRRMVKGLYSALMPLAVVVLSALCGLVLSMVLSDPISEIARPAAIEVAIDSMDGSLVTVDDIDLLFSKLEEGMSDEMREALNMAKVNETAKQLAKDSGDSLAEFRETTMTDENMDALISAGEEALPDAVREESDKRGLGDTAREYAHQAGETIGNLGETVLTEENAETVVTTVEKDLNDGAKDLYGDPEEHRASREAIRAAGDDRMAAIRASMTALMGFLVPRYVRLIVFAVGTMLFLVVFTVIKNALGLVFDLPVIGHVDKIVGAALGFVEGVVLIWLVMWTCAHLGFRVFQDLAQGTVLMKLFV